MFDTRLSLSPPFPDDDERVDIPRRLGGMPLGFPVARPCMTTRRRRSAVWPATSNSSPKSLVTVAPGTARHWLVWQCRSDGAPAATGTLGHEPFSRVGEDLEHALVRVRRGERDFIKRERLANRVVGVAYERGRFERSRRSRPRWRRRRVQHDLHFLAVPHQVVVPRGVERGRPRRVLLERPGVARRQAGCVDADTAHERNVGARIGILDVRRDRGPLATFASITARRADLTLGVGGGVKVTCARKETRETR